MKVWFFKKTWKSSGGWKTIYHAVTAQCCHMTSGSTLPEVIYMAHDLVACIKDDDDEEKFYDEPFEYLNDGIFEVDSRNLYIGELDIDVDIYLQRGWVRAGDKAPKTRQHPRFEMIYRAFCLSYQNFKFGGVANEH